MERVYKEAFTEVDKILRLMPIDLLSKIPMQFRKIISDNKAIDYNVKIEEPINENELKDETIVILGLIYRDFLASPEEREQLQLRDAQELKRIEETMKEQYDVENVFKKRKNKDNSNITNDKEYSTDLTIYKEPNFLQKFFDLIKGIFKKNKF